MQTTHTAQTTLAPISPAVASRLRALQAEIIKEASQAEAVPAGAIVLTPLGKTRAHFRHSHLATTLELTSIANNEAEDSYSRYVQIPEGWHTKHWHPSHWYKYFLRTDDKGRSWSACGGVFVMDDFGFLVEVPA